MSMCTLPCMAVHWHGRCGAVWGNRGCNTQPAFMHCMIRWQPPNRMGARCGSARWGMVWRRVHGLLPAQRKPRYPMCMRQA